MMMDCVRFLEFQLPKKQQQAERRDEDRLMGKGRNLLLAQKLVFNSQLAECVGKNESE